MVNDLIISTANYAEAQNWKSSNISWSELSARLHTTKVTNETLAEFLAMDRDQQKKIKDVGGFVGGQLDGKRKKENLKSRSVLTLDVDFGSMDFANKFKSKTDFAFVIHSTHKHSASTPKFRIVAPLSRPVNELEFEAIGRKVAELTDIEMYDKTTFQASRLMFWPSTPSDQQYYVEEVEGDALNVESYLAMYGENDAWRDTSKWCVHAGESKVAKVEPVKLESPSLKMGLVGLFCRTYDIRSAIEKFLGDVYTPCDNRYTYIPGTSAGGLCIYDGGEYAYSHQHSDPIAVGGHNYNAYDLVRVHLFGKFDAISKDGSIYKMNELVQNDAACQGKNLKEMNNVTMGSVSAKSDGDAWLLSLKSDKTGRYLSTLPNIKTVLANDPEIKGSFGFDLMRGIPVMLKDAAWNGKKAGEALADSDDGRIAEYLEAKYEMSSASKFATAMNIVIDDNKLHPLRDYLDSLVWDGVERAETAIIDYLGADDNCYTREATMIMFNGAIARATRDTSTKHDVCMIFRAEQGLGKSTFLKRLGKKWFNDSLTTMSGKEAYEQIQGSWIVELAELSASRRSEVEEVKNFISKEYDKFRPAYGKRTIELRRQNVFFGSTNSYEFLKDQTGSRRFFPVNCKRTPLTSEIYKDSFDDIVDQIWAEVYAKQKINPSYPPVLSPEAEALACEFRETHTERDPRTSLVEDYLESPKPEGWLTMSDSQRSEFLTFGSHNGNLVRLTDISVIMLAVDVFKAKAETVDTRLGKQITSILEGSRVWKPEGLRLRTAHGVTDVFSRVC